MYATTLERKIEMLPPELQSEVMDFVDFLNTKKTKKKTKTPKLDWMGGLKEYREQYTSVELEDKASNWRDQLYLIDTNILLEGLLEQEKADSVRSFFSTVDLGQMAITDLALHSIGIILFRFGKYDIFNSFLNDLIIDGI